LTANRVRVGAGSTSSGFRDELRRNKAARTRREHPKSTAQERREEQDHEVLVNIPEPLIPLWESVRRQIKGSARRSRTEAFLQYAEEHPDEVIAAQERDVERFLKAEQARMAREAGETAAPKRKRPKGRTKAIDAYCELADFFDSVALDG
jgi:hypothetical protein